MANIANRYKVYADKIYIGMISRTESTWHLLSTSAQFPYAYPSFGAALEDCITCAGYDETYTITCIPVLHIKTLRKNKNL